MKRAHQRAAQYEWCVFEMLEAADPFIQSRSLFGSPDDFGDSDAVVIRKQVFGTVEPKSCLWSVARNSKSICGHDDHADMSPKMSERLGP